MKHEDELLKSFFQKTYEKQRFDFEELELNKKKKTFRILGFAASVVVLFMAGFWLLDNVQSTADEQLAKMDLTFKSSSLSNSTYTPLSEWQPITDNLLTTKLK